MMHTGVVERKRLICTVCTETRLQMALNQPVSPNFQTRKTS